MHKIGIIGPGSADVAALIAQQYSGLHPECEFITLGEVESVSIEPEPRFKDYGAILMSHSFEFDYKPTQIEEEWLRGQMSIGLDWAVEPIPIHPGSYKVVCWDGRGPMQQGPKHRSEFTRSQPTRQARKAARRRAKAGRRASR